MTPDQRLSTIFQIARTMSRTRDLAVILPQFLASLIDALPAADAGLLLLYDPAIHCLKTVAARGHDETIMQQLYLAVNESLPGQAFQSGQIQFSATPEDTARAMATMTPHNYALLCAATVGVHGAQRSLRTAHNRSRGGRCARTGKPAPGGQLHNGRPDLLDSGG